MPRKAVLPGPDELQEMLRGGETRTSISKHFGVTRSAVSLALLRAGKEPGQMRHESLIPWQVKAAHLQEYAPRMLRIEGRRRLGLPVGEVDLSKLETWKRDLAENEAVIMYLPDHACPHCEGQGGFHPVRRADAIEKFGPAARGVRHRTDLRYQGAGKRNPETQDRSQLKWHPAADGGNGREQQQVGIVRLNPTELLTTTSRAAPKAAPSTAVTKVKKQCNPQGSPKLVTVGVYFCSPLCDTVTLVGRGAFSGGRA